METNKRPCGRDEFSPDARSPMHSSKAAASDDGETPTFLGCGQMTGRLTFGRQSPVVVTAGSSAVMLEQSIDRQLPNSLKLLSHRCRSSLPSPVSP